MVQLADFNEYGRDDKNLAFGTALLLWKQYRTTSYYIWIAVTATGNKQQFIAIQMHICWERIL